MIKLKRLILILLIALWMFTIYYFSSQNGELSEATSDIITDRVYELIYGKDNKQAILNNQNEKEKNNKIENKTDNTKIVKIPYKEIEINLNESYNQEPHEKAVIRYIIRKIAHFTIFFIGGILIFSFFNTYEIPTWKKILFTLIFTTLYAGTDEIHQRFVEARDGKIEDVLLDAIGSLTGVLIANMFRKIKSLNNIK